MKKVIIAIAVFSISMTVFARPKGLNLGAGVSMDILRSSFGSSSDMESYIGSFMEVGYDLDFTPVVGIYLGGRLKIGVSPTYNLHDEYQEAGFTFLTNFAVPVQLTFNIPVRRSCVFINVGPTFDAWLGYNSIVIATTSSAEVYTEYINYFEDNSYNRFNVYLGGKVGVNIRHHVKVYGAYDRSLINYVTKDLGKTSIGEFRIGAAYVF